MKCHYDVLQMPEDPVFVVVAVFVVTLTVPTFFTDSCIRDRKWVVNLFVDCLLFDWVILHSRHCSCQAALMLYAQIDHCLLFKKKIFVVGGGGRKEKKITLLN